MMLLFTISTTLLFPLFDGSYGAYPNVYKKIQQYEIADGEDPGEPLILTTYLNQNRIEEAKEASKVTVKGFESIPSYSGYFTVDDRFDSNMFFWFIPSQNDYKKDPVLLWLQGGPGASSLYAAFVENGPYVVSDGGRISFREYSWTKEHSVLYIDNPVGTGFSFTNGGYARNETKVGEDLYTALLQFFTLFSEVQQNEFFVAGESYAGKYVPAIGYTIHRKNPSANVKINLQGILIGDGLTDPENQITEYGRYLYEIGFIDKNTKEIFEAYEDETVEYIRKKEFLKAFLSFDLLLNGDFTSQTLFQNATGFSTYFNYLFEDSGEDSSYEAFLQTAAVRKGIHVGSTPYSDGVAVETNLREDIMQSVAPWVVELLSNYRVLFFNGQLDIIVAYPLTLNFLQKLEFSAAADYKAAARHIWYVDGDVAGYSKVAGNLTEVLVRASGHMVPLDQPKWGYDLVYRFVRNKPIHD